ncbi:uncharacterized protein LOC117119524 [Anneissia japonica]|uniref:uncharacterized protein LOC117119524 n=1 Tax=Anneissia japonica TaxID=1529436 RepID=UPI001425642A|nr:uncharacterized protein LOC117119524 [Anneissia japonica]
MMRVYTCLVALCCVAGVGRAQNKCCINHDIYTFTGEVYGAKAAPYFESLVEERAVMTYDFNQSRFRFNITAKNSSRCVIQDFNQNTTWFIFPDSQECKKNNSVGRMPTRCVADNVQYIDEVNNPGDVLVNRWKYKYEYQSDDENGEGPREYTKDGCLLTESLFFGTWPGDGYDVDVLYVLRYYNYQVLTDTTEYFILPSYCNST